MTVPAVPGDVRYPRRFEIFRLEALGDDPFLTDAEARDQYEQGRRLAVTDAGSPPTWYLDVLPGRQRFTITFYSPHKTPVREVVWEPVDGRLLRRRALEVFYPEGDPKRRVPYSQLLTVDQHWYADGVARIVRSSPIDEDVFAEIVAGEQDRLDVPEFGEWSALIAASTPADMSRFDVDAIDAAEDVARAAIAVGKPLADTARWSLPASVSTVLDTVTALTAFEPTPSLVPIIERDAAKILPVFVQGASPRQSGLDAREERRRVDELSSGLAGAFEYASGRPIPFPLDQRGDGPLAEYAASLRSANARSAQWWVLNETGVVVVRSGDEDAGDLALAVHLVPARWVSGRSGTPTGRPSADLRWSRADLRE